MAVANLIKVFHMIGPAAPEFQGLELHHHRSLLSPLDSWMSECFGSERTVIYRKT
jgi:hypothetical protein